jgi:hypothetical protein
VARRNLIPLVLLAVLAFLTLVFALLGASSAPSGATLTVQNASAKTFGSPTGSNSFTMDIVSNVAARTGRSATQVRQVVYQPPDNMVVYLVAERARIRSVLSPAAAACDLSIYTAYVGGSTSWTPASTEGAFTRTESLAAYSSRVPRATSGTCEPVGAIVQGHVDERVVLREGYLVGLRLVAVVPPQTLPSGRPAVSGTESETFVLSEINGTRTFGH